MLKISASLLVTAAALMFLLLSGSAYGQEKSHHARQQTGHQNESLPKNDDDDVLLGPQDWDIGQFGDSTIKWNKLTGKSYLLTDSNGVKSWTLLNNDALLPDDQN